MKLGKYIEQLRDISKALANEMAIVRRVDIVAGKAIEAEYRKRIFVDGKDTALRNIGHYNLVKPLYINSKDAKGLPKSGLKPPQGKYGNKYFKNGKPHKTKYFASYSDFRKAVGRQNKLVDLNLTGSTFESVTTAVQGNRIILGYRDRRSYDKMTGNEKHFGKLIKNISNRERKVWQKAVALEIQKVIQEILTK